MTTEHTEYTGPEFVIVLRDDRETSSVSIAGLSRPEVAVGQPLTEPCHIVGAYICNHFDEILRAAEAWVFGNRAPDADGDASPGVVDVPMIEAKAALLEQIEKEAS